MRKVGDVLGWLALLALWGWVGWGLYESAWFERRDLLFSLAVSAAWLTLPILGLALGVRAKRWLRVTAYSMAAVATVLLAIALTRIEAVA